MDMWKKFSLGLATAAGLTPSLWAQAVPAAPAVAAPAAPVPVAAPAAQPQTLCGFLGFSKENLAECKAKFCASPFGNLVNNATLPLGALSGGMITSCCPTVPTDAEIAKLPPNSEGGAAARIKKSEAEAKARRAAVRYLGTVDCRYWPEAQAALVKALRFDPNECVRWEAAMALGRGCCCNKVTIAALTEAVSDNPKDKAPAELSERVKASASFALSNCLAKVSTVVEPVSEPLPVPRETAPKELPPAPQPQTAVPGVTDYYAELDKIPMEQLIERAHHCLAQGRPATGAAARVANVPGSDKGLIGIFVSASKNSSTPSNVSNRSMETTAMAQPADMPGAMTETATPIVNTAPPPMMKTPPAYIEAAPQKTTMPVSATSVAPAPLPSVPTAKTAPTTTPARDGLPAVRNASPVSQPLAPPAPVAMTSPVFSTAPDMMPAVRNAQSVSLSSTAPAPVAMSVPAISSGADRMPVIRNAPPAPKITPSLEASAAVTPVVHQAPATPSKKPDFPAPGSTTATLEQMLNVLQLAPTASERVWAAINLVNVDWHENPQMVQALVSGARRDSTVAVRIECVRSLAKVGANTQPVMAALQALRTDSDAMVRLEANLALNRLMAGQQSSSTRMVK